MERYDLTTLPDSKEKQIRNGNINRTIILNEYSKAVPGISLALKFKVAATAIDHRPQ